MNITINPIYNKYFPENSRAPQDFGDFSNYPALSEKGSPVDFLIEKNWISKAKAIVIIVLKIIFFPWGLYELTKGIVERIALQSAYPAQSMYGADKMDRLRARLAKILGANENLIRREVTLEKEGHRYNGLILGHESTISNGKWAIFAPGNDTAIEREVILERQEPFLQAGYNVLFVNSPGVGKSQGPATVDRIGDAQEIALSFLETAIKAKKIILAGHSFGGAAIGNAALKHTFKTDVDYLVFQLMTFDRLTHITKERVGLLESLVLRIIGCEMDNVAASKKLQQEGIHEVIIQGGEDRLMDKAPLLEALQKENLMENKTGIMISDADHYDLPVDRMTDEIVKWDVSRENSK